MQTSVQSFNGLRVKSNSPIKIQNPLIKSCNSKVNTSQYNGTCAGNTSKVDLNFNFKYVTEAELQVIVKQVRRERQKKKDEEKWNNFLTSRQSEVAEDSSNDGVCQCCIAGEVSCGTEPVFLHTPTNCCKGMESVEEDKVQGSLLTSTIGPSIADTIGHTYQLGGVLTKRLQDLASSVSRMTSLLLSSVTTRSAQYEDEDVDRAIKRSVEFDAMFSRNHLYEIQRLLKDSKQLASGKFPRDELETKISAALKCVMQAIQVYTRHVSKGARVKYQQVVPIFQSISTIYSLLEHLTGQHAFPFRQELEVSCSYMKQLLLEMSTTDTHSVTTVSRKPVRSKPVTRHKPSADLSMYSRRRADWRHKTASLARAKFGPPSSKKNNKKSDRISENGNVDKNKADFNQGHKWNSKVSDECERPEAKEVPYRNATRAVPEDNVITMMEMISKEPIEDGGLCLDDSTFQALKQLNESHAPLHQDSQLENGSAENLENVDTNCHKSIASNCSLKCSQKPYSSDTKSPAKSKITSARSIEGEPNNVQLICLREEEFLKYNQSDPDHGIDTSSVKKEAGHTGLTIDDESRTEALEYHKQMLEYHETNTHYKDGKALDIVDRLATRILTEMVINFQKEEMNNVIQTLYNLEFQ